ncbi:PAS domain S-box protein [Flavobacterium sp. PL002]|uniref:PAS domain S-box protein n=1 Tax=Flavobacterium sp. PL002 TaxID=1897058 RepID=UPI0017886E53|nr:PAS domain S-box protein [Flavobacterium sp. PL002]MBE0391363.1 putative diguanylate cyclase YegE [Flavobacterium sp. PL002]
MNYLKDELYELLKEDVSIFDFIQEYAINGISFSDLENPEKSWMNAPFFTMLGYDSKSFERSQLTLPSLIISEKKSSNEIDKNYINQKIIFKNKEGNNIITECKAIYIKNKLGNNSHILKAYKKCNIVSETTLLNEELKKEFEKLKKQDAFLDQCNRAANIGYWEIDLVSQKLNWSSMTKVIHETSFDYIPNIETAIDFYKEGENRDLIEKSFKEAVAKGTPFNHELQIITLKGNTKWVRSIGQAAFSDGVCTRVYGTFQDITVVKEAHIALTTEKEKLISVLKGTNTGTWERNIQTEETHHSEIWAEIIGYPLAELQPISSKKWEKLVHPDDLLITKQKLEEYFNKKTEYYNAEYRIRHKNGHWIWVLDKGKVISWTENNKPLVMFGTHYDITEQKKINQRNIHFIEQTPTAIAMFDNQMNYLASSEKWKSDYQLNDEKIIGKCHYDIFPEIKQEWKAIHQKCLMGIPDHREEDVFIRKDGSIQWLKWEIKPWHNDNGSIGGLIMYTADITVRKQFQEKLRISEEAFRGNFENAAIGMGLLNTTGQWLKVNTSLCKLLGFPEEEMVTQNFQKITHPDDLQADLNLLDELIKGRRSFYHLEKRFICKNERVITTILSASLVRDENQEPLYFIVQIIDITAQKKAELQLADTIAKTQGLIEASTRVAIIETSLDGIIRTFNKGAENLLGYKKEEIIGIATPLLIHVKDEIQTRTQELTVKYNQPIEEFQVFTLPTDKGDYDTNEWTYIRKDGSQFPVQLTITAIKKNEVITGYLGIAVDITYIKETEKEIQSLLTVTKDQNERLKNFAHIVSHNLRSHSGNITMMMDLLLYEQPEIADNEIVNLLKTASVNLQETIKHLNEVVLMNSAINENLQSLNLHDYVELTIENTRSLIFNTNIKIINEIPKETTILALPAYLESILLNLITNAIKYKSEERDSMIKISSTQKEKFVILEIEDNGIGIDMKKNSSKIFGMYKTFHDNKDARGIGLFITKNQVEALEGKIEVISKENIGTTFKIYFKYEKN